MNFNMDEFDPSGNRKRTREWAEKHPLGAIFVLSLIGAVFVGIITLFGGM